MNSETHFHIQWSTTPLLDWQAFPARKEADETARNLVRPYETYTIAERNGKCERCAKFRAGAGPQGKLELDCSAVPEDDAFVGI